MELWTAWKDRCASYATATKLDDENGAVYVSVFLTVISPEAHAVFHTFTWDSPADKQDLDKVINAFDAYFEPRRNIAYKQYQFNLRGQKDGETLEQYITTLRHLSMWCSFENITIDEISRDRLIFGIRAPQVRKWLLCETNLTLTKALDICWAADACATQLKELGKLTDSSGHGLVHVVYQKQSTSVVGQARQAVVECQFCGRGHARCKEVCPVWGKHCAKCNKVNHFAVKCRQKLTMSSGEAVHALANMVDVESE